MTKRTAVLLTLAVCVLGAVFLNIWREPAMANGITTTPSPDLTQIIPTLDAHSSFTWEKFLNHGIDAHFDGGTKGGDGITLEQSLLASTFWTRNTTLGTERTGQFVCPASLRGIVAESKNAFNSFACETVMANLTVNGQAVFLGFENGGATSTGLATFYHHRAGGADLLEVVACSSDYTYVDITAALPADYKSAAHRYGVTLLRDWTEFYIDDEIVAIGLNMPEGSVDPAVAYAPYAIFARDAYATKQHGYVEMMSQYSELTLSLSPYNVGLANTNDHPARTFPLYQNGSSTLFAGAAIGAGSLTSHPVPILGYGSKTVLFQATQNGTLAVQLYMQDGNWRTLASVATTADTLTAYSIAVEGVLARIVFTPGAYSCTVSSAEVSLTP